MKALGSSIEGWKHQMNDAGAQAAAVLALVQSDGSEIRYRHRFLVCLFLLLFCLFPMLLQCWPQSNGSGIRYRHSILSVSCSLLLVCFDPCYIDFAFVHVGGSQDTVLECCPGNDRSKHEPALGLSIRPQSWLGAEQLW